MGSFTIVSKWSLPSWYSAGTTMLLSVLPSASCRPSTGFVQLMPSSDSARHCTCSLSGAYMPAMYHALKTPSSSSWMTEAVMPPIRSHGSSWAMTGRPCLRA